MEIAKAISGSPLKGSHSPMFRVSGSGRCLSISYNFPEWYFFSGSGFAKAIQYLGRNYAGAFWHEYRLRGRISTRPRSIQA